MRPARVSDRSCRLTAARAGGARVRLGGIPAGAPRHPCRQALDPSPSPGRCPHPGRRHRAGDLRLRRLSRQRPASTTSTGHPFFGAWELRGRFPDLLHNPASAEAASALYADAQAMLDRIEAEQWLRPPRRLRALAGPLDG
ncbi:MAG: vitamin B12 dependent-methionine synthase activation domain-containing protein [Dermatophilaceae bacterium]